MGVLNVTPDSFSDGGKYYELDSAVQRGIELLKDGADIIDVGGESTRPGAEEVPVNEELKRVLPVIEALLKIEPDAIISIDTTKSIVAEEALKTGAKIINDIGAFEFDKKILTVAAEFNAPYILMHMKGTPRTMQNSPEYSDVVSEIIEFLSAKTEEAKKRGVENVIVDPGIGFGKSVENNFEILRRLSEFKSLNYPILIGLSRKSFIGKSLNLEVENRDEPTSLLEALSVKNGASIIRTHNVKLANQTRNILSRL
ncbi:MAG: dihydropteroate synthase [Chlorobi bacterium]|nr:dihydropteroate synthase [Chlorobiota bacterium]